MTEFATSGKLLEYLPRRGKRTFHLFCQALEKASQPHLAMQLRQGDNTFNQPHGSQISASHSNQTNDRPPLKKFIQLWMLHWEITWMSQQTSAKT